jgi:nucleotide-binding universal stress UspA family protein
MTQRGPIVCATDLGRTGARAVDLAARMATATGRPLRLIHVTGAGPDLSAEPRNEGERVLRERLRTRIEAAAAALEKERVRAEGLGPHAEAELLEGRPWEQVIEYATRAEASFVVLGPHGEAGALSTSRGGLTEWILGSTADRVIRHAPCPVLVGPREGAEAPRVGGARWLVPVDFSEASRAALSLAKELAGDCDATLVPFHVASSAVEVEAPARENDPIGLARAMDTEQAKAKEQELAALVKDELGVDLEVRVALGEPAELVAEAADELGVALIVMGTRGRTGLSHLLLGSTTERTLRRAHVPVLCVKP